jgi:hypothetical protein
MISLKKALFAACIGLGMAVSMSAVAAPGVFECEALVESCLAGDTHACYTFKRLATYCHQVGVFMP